VISTLKTFLPLVLRILLGAVLFYAGFSKLNATWEFAGNIANFRLLPPQLNQVLALILPWMEIIAGVLLFFNLWVRAAGIVSTALFSAFFVAVVSALIRGLDIDCGCFGPHSTKLGLVTLAMDVGGLVASVIVVLTAHFPKTEKVPGS
jgi:putative oxidoreductase